MKRHQLRRIHTFGGMSQSAHPKRIKQLQKPKTAPKTGASTDLRILGRDAAGERVGSCAAFRDPDQLNKYVRADCA